MLADFISGEEAYRLGILDRLVPHEKLEAETRTFTRRLADGPPIAHRITKMLVNNGLNQDLRTALAEGFGFHYIALTSADHQEGVSAFAQRRSPVFKGE